MAPHEAGEKARSKTLQRRGVELVMFALAAGGVVAGAEQVVHEPGDPLHWWFVLGFVIAGLVMATGFAHLLVSLRRRRVVNVSVEHLASFYRDHLAIQAAQLAKVYIGSWITVSGTLASVGEVRSGGTCQVTFDHNLPLSRWGEKVFMYFGDRRTIRRLATMQRGTPLTVQGRIFEIDKLGVSLERCEIVCLASTCTGTSLSSITGTPPDA